MLWVESMITRTSRAARLSRRCAWRAMPVRYNRIWVHCPRLESGADAQAAALAREALPHLHG
jgi:hypothetical protein